MTGYIRKAVTAILILVFIVAAVIGVGVITTLRNVNVEYIYYSSAADGESDAEYLAAVEELNALKCENLMFLEDERILDCVTGNRVYIESYKKVFPCSVEVVLRERVEQYVRRNSQGLYDVYDVNGVYLETRASALNPSDSSPDVLLDVDDRVFGSAIEICAHFRDSFGSIRDLVSSVTAGYDGILETSEMTLHMYSGLSIVVCDYDEFTAEKIQKVCEEYGKLSEAQKLKGAIYAVSLNDDAEGDYAAYYNPDLDGLTT